MPRGGAGTYDKSIKVLKILNELGYGQDNTGLELNLVYNPAGAFMPGSQEELEKDFKRALKRDHGIVFNNLFTITNLPISRYLNFLLQSGNLEEYMEKLITSFNPSAAEGPCAATRFRLAGTAGYMIVISIKCSKLKPIMVPRSIFVTGMKRC